MDAVDQVGVADIAAAGARIAEIARAEPHDLRLPGFARWRLGDLVAHLGGVHRWATAIVDSRSWDGGGHRRLRARGDELCAQFEHGLAALCGALDAADPDDPCPNFCPGATGVVGWWTRRQVHETTVHRWDAESATASHTPILPRLATDGVDEYLDVFVRPRGRQPLDAPLGLATRDTGRAWTLTPDPRRPGRVTVADGDDPRSVARIVASAEGLLLVLWGRRSLEAVGAHVTGDRAVVERFRPA